MNSYPNLIRHDGNRMLFHEVEISYDTQLSLKDAMAVAQDIKKASCKFLVIGLKIHQKYLTELSQVAGGKVHIFREFDEQSLENTVLKYID